MRSRRMPPDWQSKDCQLVREQTDKSHSDLLTGVDCSPNGLGKRTETSFVDFCLDWMTHGDYVSPDCRVWTADLSEDLRSDNGTPVTDSYPDSGFDFDFGSCCGALL